MRNEPLRALVFDFDGTLAVLNLDFALMKRRLAALAEVFLEEAVSPDGLPALEWVDHLAGLVLARSGRDLSLEFHTRCRFLIMDMEIKAATQGRLFPSTRPMLAALRGRGLRTAVVTRNCGPAVSTVFPDIMDSVDCLVARESAPRVKPDPAHLLAALDRLGAAPGEALMVGDHPMDVLVGQRAGTVTAAVASGRLSLDELREPGPDFLAKDCASLVDMLIEQGLLAE